MPWFSPKRTQPLDRNDLWLESDSLGQSGFRRTDLFLQPQRGGQEKMNIVVPRNSSTCPAQITNGRVWFTEQYVTLAEYTMCDVAGRILRIESDGLL